MCIVVTAYTQATCGDEEL